MRGFSLGMGLGSQVVGGGPPAPPPELFPDPNLEDVTDASNGWSLINNVEPTGTTGPGLTFFGAQDDTSAALVGSNLTAFDAAVANSSTKTVVLTVGIVTGTVIVSMKEGTPVSFSPVGAGDVSHSVTAGTGSGFVIIGDIADPATCGLVHISVTT